MRITRRDACRMAALSAAGLRAGAPSAAAQPRTFTYKSSAGEEIKADLWGAAGGRKPAAMWIHGGALIMGSRRLSPSSRILNALLDAGFAVASIDYRLAPETKLPAIIEDVRDAWRWLRREASHFGIDERRLVVCGGSAGGYLTLMTGFCVRPRPRALVSFWGYGDIVGDWYARPDPFYLKQPRVSREQALAALGDQKTRGRFYLYCRQNGLWPREVAGRDPSDQRWFDRYCPVRNVTRDYPPTMLVHGTADTDVPYEQSTLMAARLRQAGVPHEMVTVPGGGHGLGNVPPEEQERLYRRAAAFLARHV